MVAVINKTDTKKTCNQRIITHVHANSEENLQQQQSRTKKKDMIHISRIWTLQWYAEIKVSGTSRLRQQRDISSYGIGEVAAGGTQKVVVW